KASSTRPPFAAAPAGAKSVRGGTRPGAFIAKAWRASKTNERLRPYDIELYVVSVGLALGGVRFVDRDFCKDRPRRRRFGLCHLDPHRGHSRRHCRVRPLRREVERSVRAAAEDLGVSHPVGFGDRRLMGLLFSRFTTRWCCSGLKDRCVPWICEEK